MENKMNDVRKILQGDEVFSPEYIPQPLAEYSGNPFIEALPSIFTDEEIIEEFTLYPQITEEEKKSSINVRYHYIKRLKDFVQPLDIHFKIERKLSTMIRRGYNARNPNTKEYVERTSLIRDVINQPDKTKLEALNDLGKTVRTTAESFSITGISGIGKSVSIERLLMMYPQVIHHEEYEGNLLTMTQIVWLKLDTPHDGSIKTLCKMFFKKVDDIMDTTYTKKFGSNRDSASTMVMNMAFLSSLYAIGVIVIDEIQHLTNPKQNPDEVLNFIVTLVNTIGVPVIMIGTPSAEKILKKNFRQARRAEGIGSITWQRMPNDEVWEFFVETMWQYQWLDEFTSISQELIDALYDECQGITALAVNVFMLAQELALESGEKRITKALFKEVSKTDLRLVQSMINALRTNNIQEIVKYDDIVNNIDEILHNRQVGIEHRNAINKISKNQAMSRKINKNSTTQGIISEILSFGMFKNVDANDIEKSIDNGYNTGLTVENKEALKQYVMMELLKIENVRNEEQPENCKPKQQYSQNDLRILLKKSKEEKRLCYELLLDNGYIKNPFDEFYC